MRTYTGVRTLHGVRVHVSDDQDPPICGLLLPREGPRVSWPRSIHWSYAGAASSSLALALIADALGNDKVADDVALDAATEVANRKPALSVCRVMTVLGDLRNELMVVHNYHQPAATAEKKDEQ